MRHARQSTAHPALVGDILALLREAHQDAGQAAPGWAGAAPAPGRLIEPLSQAEIRVLRYLPTGLTVNEIAGQMYLSANTVRTHLRHLYAKLAVHRRHEAVDRGRALGLLAPSVR